ncbi:hypothetical protein FJW06_08375 [Mesorhizobium sp. B4-1-3]|uniref:hypothetical protein n=1 Tax=Mesorhizobium sp. B4-1-3 TaxID=2589889 RepID=UPI00112BF836|nr:hypothetical protein [Mesorhizobium sp. B4-1-3]TPI15407.1 hypothetical protein FJW06_08375 [Mesorhizobium sp. B4-1-3]
MEIQIPFKVEYQTAASVPIPEIINSLLALQRVLEEAGKNLENFVPGLTVLKVDVRVQQISTGSLKEILAVGLFALFQDELRQELPQLIHDQTGYQVPANADTLLVILALVAIVYGADFVQKLVLGKVHDTPTQLFKRALIKDLAQRSGRSEKDVKAFLDKRYGVKSRIKQLGDSAVKFFMPSKKQANAPILVNDTTIDSSTVADAPMDYAYQDAAQTEKSRHHDDVTLEIHAQDKDREASGWAAVPVGLHDKRLRMKLMDAATPEQLWGRDRVKGDIVLVSKRVGLDFEPSEIHLVRIHDE